MQTNFSAEQLSDPGIAHADEILRRCVHCGLCNATCPTYVLGGDERDSPRGRIYLIKHMLESGERAGAEVTTHIDRCMSCLSCMTTCPNGVNYMHLVDHARGHIEATAQRGVKDRLVRRLLRNLMSDPERLRTALRFAGFARPLAPLLRWIGLKELAAMLAQAPAIPALESASGASDSALVPATAAPQQGRRKRVVLLAGCTQQVLRPEINEATIRLLARRGVDVALAPNVKCCGALDKALGGQARAVELARINIDAWMELIEADTVDAIVINAAGCGTAVKDYGHLLRGDPEYAERAARIAELACDVTEFLAGHDLGPPKRWSSLRIAYHSACSMRHGQGIDAVPRALLTKAGFAVAEVPEGHLCCGASGAFNILQSDIATKMRDAKVANIGRTKADLVAAGNFGCIAQLQTGIEIPIAHTVELLDWAYGGPVPRGLEKLSRLVNDVPQPEPEPLVLPPPLPKPKAAPDPEAASAGKSVAGRKKPGKKEPGKKEPGQVAKPAPVSA